jgi:hypothetical protein
MMPFLERLERPVGMWSVPLENDNYANRKGTAHLVTPKGTDGVCYNKKRQQAKYLAKEDEG